MSCLHGAAHEGQGSRGAASQPPEPRAEKGARSLRIGSPFSQERGRRLHFLPPLPPAASVGEGGGNLAADPDPPPCQPGWGGVGMAGARATYSAAFRGSAVTAVAAFLQPLEALRKKLVMGLAMAQPLLNARYRFLDGCAWGLLTPNSIPTLILIPRAPGKVGTRSHGCDSQLEWWG